MPNCQNCGYQWSWLDTAKIGFINNKNVRIAMKDNMYHHD